MKVKAFNGTIWIEHDLSTEYLAINGTAYNSTRLNGQLASYYAKASDIPTSLPANGGNADTVDNYHIWVGAYSVYQELMKQPNTLYLWWNE